MMVEKKSPIPENIKAVTGTLLVRLGRVARLVLVPIRQLLEFLEQDHILLKRRGCI
jgi:hypothetical protein